MLLLTVLVWHDAEKRKLFSFTASFKNARLVKRAIYGSRQLGGKKNAVSVKLPLVEDGFRR